MKYILVVVNTQSSEYQHNEEFNSMEELIRWVEEDGHPWTSLMVTVLPVQKG